jgi:hypothetical protein
VQRVTAIGMAHRVHIAHVRLEVALAKDGQN